MASNKIMLNILYAIGLAMGVASIVLSYTGIQGNYDTEPLLGIGLFVVAVAGLSSLKD